MKDDVWEGRYEVERKRRGEPDVLPFFAPSSASSAQFFDTKTHPGVTQFPSRSISLIPALADLVSDLRSSAVEPTFLMSPFSRSTLPP